MHWRHANVCSLLFIQIKFLMFITPNLCTKHSFWYENVFLPYQKKKLHFGTMHWVAPPIVNSHSMVVVIGGMCILHLREFGCDCLFHAAFWLSRWTKKLFVAVNVTTHFVRNQCYKFSFRSADMSADLITGSDRPDMPLALWVQCFVIESVCNLAAIMPLYLQSGCISGLYAFRRQSDWITQHSFHQKSVVLTFAPPFPCLPHPKPACQLSADNSLIGLQLVSDSAA